MNGSAIRLFSIAAYGWLAAYTMALILLGSTAWTNAPVDLFLSRSRLAVYAQWRIDLFTGGYGPHLCIATLFFALLQIRRHRWWLGLFAWFLFRLITHRTWLASNGGIQLMENMLLWAAFMNPPKDRTGDRLSPFTREALRSDHLSAFSFWIARLQLPLAYAAAAAHKFTGTTWLDGSAMLRVAHDPLFHLGWLADFPRVCTALTYLTLAWMSFFPFAVWWMWPRRAVLVIGALFHLATAIFMDIPQMGFAFIACYALWLTEDEAERLSRWFRAMVPQWKAPRPPA